MVAGGAALLAVLAFGVVGDALPDTVPQPQPFALGAS